MVRKLGQPRFSKLILREVVGLELRFSEEEVGTTLKELNGDKAPKPNGYTIAFWQCNWETVKADVIGFILEISMNPGSS